MATGADEFMDRDLAEQKKRIDERIAENEKLAVEQLQAFTAMDVERLRKYMENIQGSWDGDLPGYAEERATAAGDVVEACDSLIAALKEYADGNY